VDKAKVEELSFRYHAHSCGNCNNFKINNEEKEYFSFCPLIGVFAIGSDSTKLVGWANEKTCDAWEERKEDYEIYVIDPFKKGVDACLSKGSWE
jgi:hypothetical protein